MEAQSEETSNPRTRIVVVTHKNVPMPNDPMYYPLHVGKAMSEPFGIPGDDTGDNISELNDRYCELTGLYWAWKNLDASNLGLVQYRRHFKSPHASQSANLNNVLSGSDADELLEHNAIVLPARRNYYFQTLEQHFLNYSFAQADDIMLLRKSIEAVSPQYLDAFDALMQRKSGHMFNMFIMRRNYADAYCEWLFEVMEELDSRLNDSRTRMLGYFAEHMLDAWIEKNGYPYTEIDCLFLDQDNELRKRIGYVLRLFGAKKLSDKIVKRQGS